MSETQFVKIPAATAQEVCIRFQLSSQARALLRDGMPPAEFVGALSAKQLYVPGIDFLAHALPAREAVWWGCLCMQHACGENLAPMERDAAVAVVRWVLQPTEENRAAAGPPAQAAGPATPAGSLATAVSLTGGSIAPPNAPPVAPGPYAPAKPVAAAIKLACTKSDPARISDTQRLFLNLGIEVAEGRVI
jgi:hypothetical protein